MGTSAAIATEIRGHEYSKLKGSFLVDLSQPRWQFSLASGKTWDGANILIPP